MSSKQHIRRNLFFLTAIRGVSSTAYYLFIPFFGIWLVQQELFTLLQTSVIVGVCIFTTRAASIVMPFFVRRVGEKLSIALAYGTSAAVFGAMYLYEASNMLVWQVMSGLLGVAFSVATLGMKTLIARYFDEAQRISAFSYLNVAVNVGAAVGPAIGGFIMAKSFGVLPLVAVLLQGIAVLFALFLPHLPRSEAAAQQEGKRSFKLTAPFSLILFLAVSSLTWVAYVQLYNVFPVYAQGHLDERLVGALFSINAILIILVQIPVGRWLERTVQEQRVNMNLVLLASNVLLGLSMLCLAMARTDYWVAIFLGVVLFTLSELLWSPLYDAAVMNVRGTMDVVTAFGVSGLIWGLAESFGTSFGMALIGTGDSLLQAMTPFLIGFGAALLAGILGYALSILKPKEAKKQPVAESQATISQ